MATQTAADNWLGVKTHSIPPFTATTPGTVHRCTLHAIAMHISLCKVFLACVVVTTRVTRVSGSECERGRQCADSRFYDLVRAGCVQCTLVHGTYMCNVHFVANPGSRTLLSTEIQIVIHNWHIYIYICIYTRQCTAQPLPMSQCTTMTELTMVLDFPWAPVHVWPCVIINIINHSCRLA